MNTDERTLLKQLKQHANKDRAKHDEGYIKSHFKSLGCSIPSVRKIANEFYQQEQQNIKKRVDALWHESTNHEVLTIAILYFEPKQKRVRIQDWPMLKKWSAKIDNWAHSDGLSGIYAHLHEHHPEKIEPTLHLWNRSKNPWLRRLSLTSLLYYSNSRKTSPTKSRKILPLVQNLLNDPDVYVQKAVGWTLRECGNLYPKETGAFIQQHLDQLSPIAFTAATEKWEKTTKALFKEKRKQLRKYASTSKTNN